MMPVVRVRRLRGRAVITAAPGLVVAIAAIAAVGSGDPVIAAPTIASSAQVFAPNVRADLVIGAPSIEATSAVLTPAIGAGAVLIAPPSIASTASVPAPALTSAGGASIAPATIASGSAVLAPVLSAGAVGILPATIASTAAVLAPMIASGAIGIMPGLIASTAVIYGPTVAAQASGYDSDAIALFGAMTVQPDATRKARINDLIVGLKADGVWTKLDWLVLLAAANTQHALLNWRAPSKQLQSVNSPTFTADRGYSGDGVSSYLSLGEAFNATGNGYALSSATLGVWCNLQGLKSGARPLIGSTQSTRSYIGPSNSGAGGARINDSTTMNLGAAESMLGSRIFSRTAVGTRAYYRDGAPTQSDTAAATAIATGPAFILRNGTDYADDRIPAAFSGAGLTAAEAQAIHSRINTFLTAIGAN